MKYELEHYGDHNATLYIEATNKEQILLLRKILVFLKLFT